MRTSVAALALIGIAFGQSCFAEETGQVGAGREPTLHFHGKIADPAFGSVDIQNLTADSVARLRRANLSPSQWQSVFAVTVDQKDSVARAPSTPEPLPPVLGKYQILPDGVRFTPRFSPVSGLKYRATADLSAIRSTPASPDVLILTFVLSSEVPVSPTVVEEIFPSGDQLPQNLLRFYVQFSAPMQRGQARDRIVLLGPDGRRDPAAFFNAPIELWDPKMKRLTVLLDPGRIKRGVGPNVELGPPLHSGNQYRLVVDGGMIDAMGHPLRESFAKSFRVSEAVRRTIDPRQWTIDLPEAGTRRPLTLVFPVPLDRALLAREIRILNAGRKPVTGDAVIDRHETRWAFTPSLPWRSGRYHAEIGASLEDVSGNTVWAPFDVDARARAESQNSNKQVILAFFIRAKKSVWHNDRIGSKREQHVKTTRRHVGPARTAVIAGP